VLEREHIIKSPSKKRLIQINNYYKGLKIIFSAHDRIKINKKN